MKHILFTLSLFVFSFFMNAQDNTKTCKLELTKSEILKNPFHKTCFKDVDLNEIKAFKIKFIGKPSLYIKDNKLNRKAEFYLEQVNPNELIQIFDIEYQSSDSALPKNMTISIILN